METEEMDNHPGKDSYIDAAHNDHVSFVYKSSKETENAIIVLHDSFNWETH
jgi:hypothetical protein